MKGDGEQYDYGFRIYDPRVGRFLSVDPLFNGFPYYTPYQFAGNMPIAAIDLDGLEQQVVIYYKDQHNTTSKIEVRAVYDNNGQALNQHIHKVGSTRDIAKGNVLVFESKKNKDGRDHLSIVEHRGQLTKQEQEIFNKYKQPEPENDIIESLDYPDEKSLQYQSQEFVNSKTKTYDASFGIVAPPVGTTNQPKATTNTQTVKSKINFKGDEAVTEGDVSREINSIVNMVKGKSDYNITILGNVNGEPGDDFNTKHGWFNRLITGTNYKTHGELAIARANAIKDGLVKAGLDPSKIQTKLGDPHAGMNATYNITTVETGKK